MKKVKKDYNGLKGVRVGYKRLQKVTTDYKR